MSTEEKSPDLRAREAYAKMIRSRVDAVRGSLRITKVIATRGLRTPKGDFFCGMSSSTQDSTDSEVLPDGVVGNSGMSLEDANLSHILLALEASIGVHRAAAIEGAISDAEYERRVAGIRHNALVAIKKILPYDEAALLVKLTEAA